MAVRSRKRSPGSRSAQQPTLIICQGTVTEPEYFNRLKSHYRSGSINVPPGEALDPLNLVTKAARQARDDDYARIFVVIDRDDSTIEEVQRAIKECRRLSTRKQSFELIESNSCFEVWLHAHYKRIPEGKKDRQSVQTAATTCGAVDPKSPKHLSKHFPVENWKKAQENIRVTDANTIDDNPSTAIPTVCKVIAKAGRNR